MAEKEEIKKNTDRIDPNAVVKYLQEPAIYLTELITGIFASALSDPKNLVLSAGRLVQATLKFQLLTKLGEEIEKYRSEGKIKDNYLEQPSDQQAFYELLKYIDEEVPDVDRFKAMKNLFLYSVSAGVNAEESMLAHEYMQICKKLDSGDILIIKALYDLAQGRKSKNIKDYDPKSGDARTWLLIVALQMGHGVPDLVEIHEENLMNLKLITERTYSDRSGFRGTEYYRLTTLGYKLCDYIIKYE
jgi:hypothetical protein